MLECFVCYIYIYIYIYLSLSLSLVIIKDKNRERQTKHRTKMKREKMKKRPNLDFRAPQVAFDFNHCLDFMEYIIFHCCLSYFMSILLPIGPSQVKES
jgi:hypothetical protein